MLEIRKGNRAFVHPIPWNRNEPNGNHAGAVFFFFFLLRFVSSSRIMKLPCIGETWLVSLPDSTFISGPDRLQSRLSFLGLLFTRGEHLKVSPLVHCPTFLDSTWHDTEPPKIMETYLISSPNHTLLPLQLHILLLFGIRKRPRNTQQECGSADNPQCPTTEQNAGLCERGDEGNGGRKLAAGGGRNHVSQGSQTVTEVFALDFNFVFVRDFGFYIRSRELACRWKFWWFFVR